MRKVTEKTKESFRKMMGSLIKEHREKRGMNQEALAEIVGVSRTRIPELERGETKNIDTWIACVTALGGQIKIEWK